MNYIKGSDCKEFFRRAYQNRYTWPSDFSGYQGKCLWNNQDKSYEGSFKIDKDLKVKIYGIEDDKIIKLFSSQLWEVAIHRIRRSFDTTHGHNTFTFGGINNVGTEVIVGGKNKGDRYRIKDNIVTMVYRHIHENLVEIYTEDVINTDKGYLSKSYTSQYLDKSTGQPKTARSYFLDSFGDQGLTLRQ